MKEKKIEFEVGEDGVIRTPYKDGIEGVAESLGGEVSTICRASNVEWEEVEYAPGLKRKGWTIRAAYDPKLAVCWTGSHYVVAEPSENVLIAMFQSREAAIEVELEGFFRLLPPKERGT